MVSQMTENPPPLFPPNPFDNFPPEGGRPEGLDAFKLIFNPFGTIGLTAAIYFLAVLCCSRYGTLFKYRK